MSYHPTKTFFLKFISFWLHWVFVAARGLSLVTWAGATLRCNVLAFHCGGFSFCGARALGARASVVEVHGLSSCGLRALGHAGFSSCGTQA